MCCSERDLWASRVLEDIFKKIENSLIFSKFIHFSKRNKCVRIWAKISMFSEFCWIGIGATFLLYIFLCLCRIWVRVLRTWRSCSRRGSQRGNLQKRTSPSEKVNMPLSNWNTPLWWWRKTLPSNCQKSCWLNALVNFIVWWCVFKINARWCTGMFITLNQ